MSFPEDLPESRQPQQLEQWQIDRKATTVDHLHDSGVDGLMIAPDSIRPAKYGTCQVCDLGFVSLAGCFQLCSHWWCVCTAVSDDKTTLLPRADYLIEDLFGNGIAGQHEKDDRALPRQICWSVSQLAPGCHQRVSLGFGPVPHEWSWKALFCAALPKLLRKT